MLGHALDARTSGQEDADAAPSLLDVAQETLIEELEGLLLLDLHPRRSRRIEGVALDDFVRVQILGVEGRIDRRREPDKAAADLLA
jgi:hypothetical protein